MDKTLQTGILPKCLGLCHHSTQFFASSHDVLSHVPHSLRIFSLGSRVAATEMDSEGHSVPLVDKQLGEQNHFAPGSHALSMV